MTDQHPRLAEIEAWWALIARILLFFLGGAILSYRVVFAPPTETTETIIWIAVAIGLMGQVALTGVAQAFDAVRGRL